jgi:hypothetical protein
MRIADRFTSRRSDNLRSAIAIRPKALGLITKSRIDGDLATPVLRQRGPSAYVALCKERLEVILPSFFLSSYRLSASFLSLPLRPLLIFPTLYARSGRLLLKWALGYNFSVALWVGYIALFGIAVGTGVVMVYLHEALQHRTG